MPLAKVKQRGEVTIPAEIREELGLHAGDYVDVARDGARIVLTPREPTPRHQHIGDALAEGLADARAGRVSPPFKTAKEIAQWQKSEEYKKFIAKE
jgi:AbrB family looped-hinge helix DNA binding protein